ncbi:ATP-binding protein [Achromobacter xylosoxidans]
MLLSARRRRGGVLIQVWDTGVGIAPELQEAVFTEFTRGAGAPASPPAGQGLGLGLAIVRRLAGLLHGEITLRSMPGKGSVFSLWLPAGIPSAHAAGEN